MKGDCPNKHLSFLIASQPVKFCGVFETPSRWHTRSRTTDSPRRPQEFAPVAEEDNARVADSDRRADDVQRQLGEARGVPVAASLSCWIASMAGAGDGLLYARTCFFPSSVATRAFEVMSVRS